MAEQCCVMLSETEQCPNEAKWQTWDAAGLDTYNNYCDEHLIDGMHEKGRTIVWELRLASRGE